MVLVDSRFSTQGLVANISGFAGPAHKWLNSLANTETNKPDQVPGKLPNARGGRWI